MPLPQNLIFRYLQSKAEVEIWLYEQTDLRIRGRIIGFDEYMNMVLADAKEVSVKKKTEKPLGRILLKGDNITLMMEVYVASTPLRPGRAVAHAFCFVPVSKHAVLSVAFRRK